MAQFKIQNNSDNTIIQVIAMNIDEEQNVLVKNSDSLDIISIADFKDMILGANGIPATYHIVD
jgi:menaquinone-dependent protoporphyrinogen IX oxidase